MKIFFLVTLFITSFSVFGQQALIDELKLFAPFIGKTYQGEFSDSTPDKRVIDVNHWQRVLNGAAVKLTHSLNNGEYGGETMFIWNKKLQKIEFYYFTTAGFYTQGTAKFDGEMLVSHEFVTGQTDGISEVKSTMALLPSGELKVDSHYLKNGQWVQGHQVVYQENPDAALIFK
jgi:hypothetical protein